MTILAWFLSAALLLEQASPADTKCPPEDHACKAALFVKRATNAETPQHRAQYLHQAHRAYLTLFDQTGDPKHLCAARTNFDQSLAVKEQPDVQRAAFEARRSALVSREKSAGVRCGSKPARPAKPKPSFVAAKPEADPPGGASGSRSTVAADGAASAVEPVSPTQSAPPASELAPVASESAPQTELAALAPVTGSAGRGVLPPTPQTPPPQRAAVASGPSSVDTLRPNASPSKTTGSKRGSRPGRDLVIAGGVMLGGGLLLGGVASYMGHGLLETKREADALHSMHPGPPTDAQRSKDLELAREWQQNGPPTLVLGLVGGASVAIAAILLSVGGRRMARAASHTAILPLPGGIAMGMKF